MNKRSKKKIIKLLYVLAIFFIYNIVAYIKQNTNNVLTSVKTTISENTNTVESNLEVQFIDVGQADSILIKSNDKYMLIDAGNNEDGEKLVKYFQSLGISKFEYVIGTHPHEDHIGGMDDIIDNFEIGTFYMPNVITTTKTFEDVLDSLTNKNYYLDTPNIGDTFKLGEANFEIIYVGENEDDLNDTSIVIRMDYDEISYLFTGDASSKVEEEILNKNIDVDILKVAHHGSKTASSIEFLNVVTPEYAVIEVGKNNKYNHPTDESLANLESVNAEIYRTDQDGTIIIDSNGKEISIRKVETDTDGN